MKTINYEKLYKLFEHSTPIDGYDCGRLCGHACCAGDEQCGMGLFPGESELLRGEEDFKLLDTENNFGEQLMVCAGKCERAKRPLACRIFPLFPLAVKEGGEIHITAVVDPRAGCCPLAANPRLISRRFVRRVRTVGKALLRDKECAEYLVDLSDELSDITALADLLL